MAKVKEWELRGGFAHGWYSRVRELDKDETPPMGAEPVPDTTEVSDWKPDTKEG